MPNISIPAGRSLYVIVFARADPQRPGFSSHFVARLSDRYRIIIADQARSAALSGAGSQPGPIIKSPFYV